MKKLIGLLAVLALCMSLAAPVFAAPSKFVPSITYKDGLDVGNATMDGKKVTDCVVVTSIKEAEEKKTDIQQEERDMLLDVYKKLANGEMELPLDGDYTIRELVDLSFKYEDCRIDQSHGDKNGQLLKGTPLTVDFDLNLKKSENLKVLTYVDGKWKLVEKVTVNADGTVTAVFEELCPVVFCVETGSGSSNSKTGDLPGLGLWIGVLAVSVAAVAVLLINRRKIAG